jgi:hypothetical protein
MWVSGNLLEEEARQKAKDKAEGVIRVGLSPAALKRKLAAKKAALRVAQKGGA